MNDFPWAPGDKQPALPVLAMSAVIEAKALEAPFPRVEFNDPGISGYMQFFPDFAKLGLYLLINDTPYDFGVNMTFTLSDRRGCIPHFVCSSCNKPRDFLVFDQSFICTEEYVAAGTGRSKRHRRLQLREARELLSTINRRKHSKWVPNPEWQEGVRRPDRFLPALAAVRAIQVKKPLLPRLEPIKPDSPFSTERALIMGRGAEMYDIVQKYLKNEGGLVSGLREQRTNWSRPAQPAPITETPVLAMKALRPRWPAKKSPLRTFTLSWTQEQQPLLIIDVRSKKPFILVAHRWMDADPRWQLIEAIKVDGRVRLVCPASGHTCDNLYLRNGAFASREEQNLYYDSQRGAGRSRARKLAGSSET